MRDWTIAVSLLAACTGCIASPSEPADWKIVGDWQLEVLAVASSGEEVRGTFTIDPPPRVAVTDEHCDKLPEFNPKAWGGWQKGCALKGVKAQECTVKGALDPATLAVADASSPDGKPFIRGKDYEADLAWASVGRLDGGAIPEAGPVRLSYEYWLQRIDSVVISKNPAPQLTLKHGTPAVCQPLPPALSAGEQVLLNVLVTGGMSKLTPASIFPVLETSFPAELAAKGAGSAEELLPRTMKKLRDGSPLKILAWGDSVTEGRYLPDPERQRWQSQFVERLRARYPRADIQLVTEAWSGHSTRDFLSAPPGHRFNYEERILGARPDLIITEFINDSGLKTDELRERYGKLRADFAAIGAEWIVCAPHYMRPDWMGLSSQRDVDQDPREYVRALRQFAAEKRIPLADVSQRYGRLWRQGIPYATLMMNGINHPDSLGLAVYADALMNLFP